MASMSSSAKSSRRGAHRCRGERGVDLEEAGAAWLLGAVCGACSAAAQAALPRCRPKLVHGCAAQGMEVVTKIETCAKGAGDKPIKPVVIKECGEL